MKNWLAVARKTEDRTSALVFIGFAFTLVAYWLWPFCKGNSNHFISQIFYEGMALGILCFAISLYLRFDGLWQRILFTLSVNNVIDELFLDPTMIQWNEFVAAGIMVSLIVYDKWKRKCQ